jgi:hypothetical protein
VSTTPERGFEYFDSPERDDDIERIAYMFLYVSEAVKKWPRFRRRLIKAGLKTSEQCDHIEAHVISIFREGRDVMLSAIENNDLEAMADPRLLQRLMHAHALMALFADPGSMYAYQDMIFPLKRGEDAAKRPEIGDFNLSLWEAEWDTPEARSPAGVIRTGAARHWQERENDGLRNSRGRRDCAANADAYNESVTEGPAILSVEQSERLQREVESLVSELRRVAKRVGLKPAQIDFLLEMAVHKKQQKDNPSAWKAIRERKRAALYPEILRLTESIQQLRKDILP